MKKKVIAAGHICLDITPVFPTQASKNMLQPGKLIHMNPADVHTGGSVANTGLAMKILGANVSLMGKIGNDAFGNLIMNILKRYEAEQGMIVDEKATTSYSVVLAMPGIDRIFLHHPGANDTFVSDDVDLQGSDIALFHFGYPTLMEKMYENDGAALLKLMKKVHDQGIATSLDLSGVDATSPAGQADWKSILTKTLPYVDFFVPSVEELCYMLWPERFQEWTIRAAGGDITEVLDLDRDIRPLAKMCMDLGCKVLLLKCGAPGLFCMTASEELLSEISPRMEFDSKAWAGLDFFEKSYKAKKILSGTGCGDTSIAAFLTAILEGYSPKRCLQLAAATGACCVAVYDALSGLKPLDQLMEMIDRGWEKID